MKMPVEVRRNGVGAFLMHLFGHKKKPTRLIINFLQASFSGKRGIDFVAALRLLVFPFTRRGAPCKTVLRKELVNQHILFFAPPPYKQICVRSIKKQKDVEFSTSPCSALFCGKRGIRTPGTVTRTPHFECGPFDHSGIFPFRFCGANIQIIFFATTFFVKLFLFHT